MVVFAASLSQVLQAITIIGVLVVVVVICAVKLYSWWVDRSLRKNGQ